MSDERIAELRTLHSRAMKLCDTSNSFAGLTLDHFNELLTALDRAEARAAEWKAMADEQRAWVDERFGPSICSAHLYRVRGCSPCSAGSGALVARDADEEGGT